MDDSQAERVKLEKKGYRYLDSLPDEADGLRHRTADYVRQGKIKVIEKQVYGRVTRYVKLTPKGHAWAKRTGREQLLSCFRPDYRRWAESTRLQLEQAGWVACSVDNMHWFESYGIYEYINVKREVNFRMYKRLTKKGHRLAKRVLEAQDRYYVHKLVREQTDKLAALLYEFSKERTELEKSNQSSRKEQLSELTTDRARQVPFFDHKHGKFNIEPVGDKQVAKFIMRYKARTKGTR